MLVGIRILTEYLSPDEYGKLGLSLTVAALFNEVAIGGLLSAFTRFYSIASKLNDLQRYLLSVGRLLGISGLVACCVTAGGIMVMSLLGSNTSWTGLLSIGLFAILFGSSAALNGVFNGARERKFVAVHTSLDMWLRVAFVLVAAHWFVSSAQTVLWSYVAALVLVLLLQAYRVRQLFVASVCRKPTEVGERFWAREMLRFAWPVAVWGSFTWAQQAADRWSLETFHSTADVGMYSVILQLGYFPMTLVMGMVGTFLTPIFFERTDEQQRRFNRDQDPVWRRILFAGLMFSGLGGMAAFVVGDDAFAWLVAADFRGVVSYLPLMVVAGGLYGTSGLLSVRLMSHMKVGQLGKLMVVSSTLGILLIGYLTAAFGLMGTVIGKLVFSALHLGLMYWFAIVYNPRER